MEANETRNYLVTDILLMIFF